MKNPSQTVIRAEAMLVSTLFQKGRFTVPWHQRYYDWKVDDVRALLQDIDEAVQEKRDCYFMGAIMLVELEQNRWQINDGQQRMVTISLICAVLCICFNREATGSQSEGRALRMLFDLDDTSTRTLDNAEHYSPRISPPTNDAMRYNQMIRGNRIGTNGRLTAAWTEIEKFFSPMNIEKLEKYFDFLLNKLEIACLRIPPSIDPNAVYETLNNRGKKLDDFDLVRNHLYSYFNMDAESERRRSVHDYLERIALQISGTTKASEYMRCRMQCRFGFLRKDKFYRDVRSAIHTQYSKERGSRDSWADFAFRLTKEIAAPESLELFRTITAPNPDPEFVHAFATTTNTINSPRNLAVLLRELRGYKVTQPLVFVMLNWYVRESHGSKKKRIAKIANKNLRRLATFVLRTAFVAPKFEPSHFETEFSNYARFITVAANFPDNEFAHFLRNCDHSAYGVLDDSRFQDAMTDATMTGPAKIKQFLLGINNDLQQDAQLLNERLCSVDHILPKSPQHWIGWTGFNSDDIGDWVDRIGNLTLMGPTDNKPGPKYNGTFTKKRESYQGSGIALTRELRQYDDWTPSVVKARQREMAERAVRVWGFI